jgi:hypothetical protein
MMYNRTQDMYHLVLELLHRRMFLTDTIQTNRAGYAKGIITKKTTNKETGKLCGASPTHDQAR